MSSRKTANDPFLLLLTNRTRKKNLLKIAAIKLNKAIHRLQVVESSKLIST